MVQFNLLPEVKIEYIKTQRSKQKLTVLSVVVGATCLGIFIVTFFIANVAQTQYLKLQNKNIKNYSATIKSTPDINKILTVQNQLGQLTTLHEAKHVTSRVFGYLTQVTPSDASLNKLTIDYSVPSMIVGGKASSLDTVRLFADTLKATEYQTSDGKTGKAFSEVVLTNFSIGDKGVDFGLAMKFDPILFDGKVDSVTLNVPVTAGASKEDVFKEGN